MKILLFIFASAAYFSVGFANDTEHIPECVVNTDCPDDRVCDNERCVSPCLSVCRNNTICHVTSHIAMCTCIPGYSGHPSLGCSKTEVFECEDNDDCEMNRVCLKHKCIDPCESVCGTNATCHVINHVAMCSCNPGYSGNPVVGCSQFESPERDSNDDCEMSRGCAKEKCAGVCGVNAVCQVVDPVTKCSCRPGYSGNPALGCTNTTTGGTNVTILLVKDYLEVSALDVTHSKITPVLQANETIYSVSYHYAKKFIFYCLPGRILRDVVNTSGLPVVRGEPKTVVEGVGQVRLAVDWVHDKLYWMSYINQNIGVSDLDGNNRTTIWKGSIGGWWGYIAVDPYAGYLFFANGGVVVYRMHLDGTNMTVLSSKICQRLVLHIHKKKIYCNSWNQTKGTAIINSFDYEGRQIPIGVEHRLDIFSGMDVFRDLLFFEQYKDGQDNVWSVDLANTNPTPILIKSSEELIYDLKVYHPDVQKAP